MTHDAARLYSKELALRLARTEPTRYIVSAAMAERTSRLFIQLPPQRARHDSHRYLLSPCAREGFPIAAPITWKQVEGGVRSDAFIIQDPLGRARGAGGTEGRLLTHDSRTFSAAVPDLLDRSL